MNLRLILGVIGIALIACNIPVFVDLVALSLNMWNFYVIWQIWANPTIAGGLCVLTIAGLTLYISWKKEFLNRAKGSKFASVVLLIFSLILIVGSGLQGMSTVASLGAYATRTSGWHPLTLQELAIYLLYFVWTGLAFLSGILWLVDGVTVLSKADLSVLKQEIDLESQTKYPKDVLANYVKQFPHNPAGVLELHIDKKMKEGKTRKQAIKKLRNKEDKKLKSRNAFMGYNFLKHVATIK